MPRAESVQLAHFTGTERFECLAKLGAGGFGDVYECFDRYLREPVAVKVLRHLSPDSIASFKHQFRKLALVEHHNLARLLHWSLMFLATAGSSQWNWYEGLISHLPSNQARPIRRNFPKFGVAAGGE
jgi:serine/threonine protein kinase